MKRPFASLFFWLLLCLCSSTLAALKLNTGQALAQSSIAQATTLVMLNVRSGPGLTFAILGQLAVGATVQVTGRTAEGQEHWWQIVYLAGSGQRAWISGRAEFVRISNAALVKVVTEQPPPQILTFTVTPTMTRNLGEPMTVVWATEGDRAALCRLVVTQLNCEPVAIEGQKSLVADQNLLGTSAFVLQSYRGAQKVQHVVYIRQQCQNRFSWFFGNPPVACPAAAAMVSPAAYQRFEHGLMLWVDHGPGQADDEFYVFFDESHLRSDRPHTYVTLLAPFQQKAGASLDNRTSATPPTGLFEPVSGFGMLWRGEFVTDPFYFRDLRARLGWALAPEEGYEFAKQCEAGVYPTCYLRLTGDRILRTHPDSTVGANQLWEEWQR